MQKQMTAGFNSYPFGEAALAASRKVWLASLGATVVTRDWVESEGGQMFRTLVKQGTAVESRAIRYLGDQVETSLDPCECDVEEDAQHRGSDREAGGDVDGRLCATGAAEVAAEDRASEGVRPGRQGQGARKAHAQDGEGPRRHASQRRRKRTTKRVTR